MLKRIGGVVLLGATAVACETAISDLVMYKNCSSIVREKACNHEQLLKLLGGNGETIQIGPWYDASVNFTHQGRVASVHIPLLGQNRASDVTVKVIRAGGLRWALAYNLFGGEWEPMIMDALIGMGPGGSLVSLSLLEGAPLPPLPPQMPDGTSHKAMLARPKQQ